MRVLILCLFLTGCSAIAYQSEDGKKLTIHGIGKAHFENGAEIESKPLLDFSKIQMGD